MRNAADIRSMCDDADAATVCASDARLRARVGRDAGSEPAPRACGSFEPSTIAVTSRAMCCGVRPDALEDVAARPVVEELVGQAELGDGGVDAGLAQVLTDARADAADADAVLDAHDDAVLGARGR